MEILKENASEQEWMDFTMAIVRKAYDDRKWVYWVYCDNKTIQISYWDGLLFVNIEPGKVKITCEWSCPGDISERLDKIMSDSVRYEKELIQNDCIGIDGEMIYQEYYIFRFIGEISIENRIDSEYITLLGENLEEIMEEITDYFGIINTARLASCLS